MVDYDDDDIVTLDSITHMRLRAASYIDNTGLIGQYYLMKEIVDNSVDELGLKGKDGQVTCILFRDIEAGKYQIAVRDNGRGIPPKALIRVFTNARTGGKFNQNVYSFSAGLNGVGSTVVMALSNFFRAFVYRGGTLFDSGKLNHADKPEDRKLTEYDYPDETRTGSTVFFEPDLSFFNEVDEFIRDPQLIVEYFEKMSLFVDFNMRFVILDYILGEKELGLPGPEFTALLDQTFEEEPVFDSKFFSRDLYLKSKFGLRHEDISYGIGVDHASADGRLFIDGSINILSGEGRNGSICSVNNVVFTDLISYHYTKCQLFLKKHLKTKIDDIKVRQFFEKRYNVPLWVNLRIRFGGAVFSGMEKKTFKDEFFVEPYMKALAAIFEASDGGTNEIFDEIFEAIREHLETAYAKFTNKDLKVSSSSVLASLNHPANFMNCKTSDPKKAELFIVEGQSAAEPEARDTSFQAFYAIRGKMLNSVDGTSPDDIARAREKNIIDPIYEDLIKILNLGPMLNTKNLAFEKIFLMADADHHGFHIANILLSNLWVICPELITGGHIHVIKAPLYKIRMNGNKNPMFAHDKESLLVGLCENLFYPMVEITIMLKGENGQYSRVPLNKDLLTGFVGQIYDIGEYLTNTAAEYFVEPLMLEQLSRAAEYLDDPDPEVLTKVMGVPIKYHPASDIVSCSIGLTDTHVPLRGIRDILKNTIRPMLESFNDGTIIPLVTTKKTGTYKDQPMTPMQIYGMLMSTQNSLDIRKMKGLGNMSKAEKVATCMDVDARHAHQITSVGDLEMVLNIMGKDSQHRKALLQ